MHKYRINILFFILLIFFQVNAQSGTSEKKVTIDGQVMTALITDGDTLIMADLEDISITSPRSFESAEDYRRYLYYRKCANKVYPYAREAIKIFREMEVATANLNKRKRKKHVRKLQKELKEEFSDPLKKLTRIQGSILVKMIERELDQPMHSLLKELKGGFSAGYWNQISKIYGYDLKRGYVVGDDKIMDALLQDFDISYSFK
ncbi:DUF4294 domain-containing protein [Portibacter lacus]|uniref:DUF4294 domain-containing protein n=1 Tax=Portibacter lacus TaxID=1099794 RepID=A0AA37SSI3_9BACT|nr:DUF4294 domain-containing protein [Portibacter lacus]GLR18924.1 hypothetical protein GCM10007940_35400 [Portibacter lacus]